MGDARHMLSRLGMERGVPLSAGIEISDHCNETCAHCYQVQGQKGEMSTAEIFRLIDELAQMGVLLLTLSGGEATLRKDFLEIVSHARKRGFAIRLFTNGLTMTRELARSLADLAVQNVEISLYSTHADVHDFVTGVPGSFERTVAGVRHLVEFAVSVTIKTPVMSVNEGEFDEYRRFADTLGAACSFDASEMMPREGGDRAPEAFNLSDRARVSIHRKARSAKGTDTLEAKLPARSMHESPCGAGEGILIEPNGEIRPCTMLDFDIGHALHDGVHTALTTNERGRALRNITWQDMHGCRDCALRASCTHCYASALAGRGDALGPYTNGCRAARLRYEVRLGHAPQIVAPAGRDPELGPYREIAPGIFEVFDDIITQADDALAERLGWTRKPAESLSAPALAARPGELVQIRRPGRKKPKLERVPTHPNDHVLEPARAGTSTDDPASASRTEA
jgi:radical SAM protein with 4Fe4S-binding SPASM domain